MKEETRNHFSMKKNLTLACTTMFCLIGAIGSADAATYIVTNNADNGAGSFRAAVAGSAAGDTVRFAVSTDGSPIILTSGPVAISHGLVVLGNGAANTSLSGGGASGILEVESAGLVVIDGLRLLDGAAASGAGVHIVSTSIEIRNTEIVNCDATVNGGGIYSENATLTVTNTNVDQCYAAGAAAGQGGGGLYATGAGSVTVSGSEFTSNGALSEGGGLWNNTISLSLTSTFVGGNYADGNAADQGGGGIYNKNGSLTIQAGQISSNNARGEYGSGGGVLNVGGTAFISNCAISSNNGARAGGGIESNGAGTNVELTNVLLEGNGTGNAPDTGSGGGLHITGAGNATINGGTVNNNIASYNGGGICNGTGSITLTEVVLNNNRSRSAIPGDGGGAIYNGGGSVQVNNCWITNNQADGTATDGGGVFNNGGTFTMNAGRISGNIATLSGGGVHNASGTVTITAVRISGNSASGNAYGDGGGGVSNEGTFNLVRSSVTENTATGLLGAGGGIRNTGTLSVQTSTISGNASVMHGAGVYTEGATTIARSTIALNNAAGAGGGLAVAGTGTANVSGSIIAGNTATSHEPQDVYTTAANIVSGGYNVIGRDDANAFAEQVTDVEGTSAFPVDVMLSPLALNGAEDTYTHAIQCGSPAVNAGATGDVTTDQRGLAVFADRRDVGAFELQEFCACTEIVHLAITLDNMGSETTWELIDNGTNEVLFAGGPYADGMAGTVVTEEMCLNKSCYRLVVYDAAGNGIANGGYELSDANGRLIIDADGQFGANSVIRSAAGLERSFCLPVSGQKLIDSWCAKELRYWNSTQIYASYQAGANGYEFWIFDPHGTYNRFVFSPTQNLHVCTFVNFPVPANKWLNVRVRARIGSVYTDFGKACQIRLNRDTERPSLRVDLDEQFVASAFSLFPNPNDGSNVTLLLTDLPDAQQNVVFEVYDVNGRAIQRSAFGNDGPTLNRVVKFDAALAPGVYVVRMQVNNALYTERLVVR